MVRKSGTECLRGKIQQEGWKAWTLELGADLVPLASSLSYSTTISTTKKRKKKKEEEAVASRAAVVAMGEGWQQHKAATPQPTTVI